LGHHIRIATTTAQARSQKEPFDIGLIDFNLGEVGDGLHLITVLRQEQPGARFALVTATPAAEYANRDELSGVTVLHKPVGAGDLEIWLNNVPRRTTAE
jgi:DNA-binding response OmpR family regulator